MIDKDGVFVCLFLMEEVGIKEFYGLCFDGVDLIWVVELELKLVKKFKILEKWVFMLCYYILILYYKCVVVLVNVIFLILMKLMLINERLLSFS